jgi:hypothetical protein
MLNRCLTTRKAEQFKSHLQISVLNLAWYFRRRKFLQGGSGLFILEQDEIHKGLLAVFSNKLHTSNSFQLWDKQRNYILGSFESYQRNWYEETNTRLHLHDAATDYAIIILQNSSPINKLCEFRSRQTTVSTPIFTAKSPTQHKRIRTRYP